MILILGGCGYIGSRLYQALQAENIPSQSVDTLRFNNPGNIPNLNTDFRTLPDWYLDQFSTVILLAGHSSVRMAVEDSAGAFLNNIAAFGELLVRLHGKHFIYASSSSVYNGVEGLEVDEDWINFNVGNMYDFTKFADDCLARFMSKDFVSLRFGTVAGASPNLRTDTMINAMVLSAMRDKVVKVANPQVHRPILGINDLCRAIITLIKRRDKAGIYNLASFNGTVGEIGQRVAEMMQVPIVDMAPSPTYDFSMSTAKFRNDLDFEFQESIDSIVETLINHYSQHGFVESKR